MTDGIIVYWDEAPETVSLEFLENVLRDACQAAHISAQTLITDCEHVRMMRMKLVRAIFKHARAGERDPIALRVKALRSTLHTVRAGVTSLP